MEEGQRRTMFRTVAQCEAAIADCEARISILKASLTDVSARPESRKRERLIQIANNTVRFLELQLESLRQDLIGARKRQLAADWF